MGVHPEDLYSTEGERAVRSADEMDLGPDTEEEYYERLAERGDALEQQVEILERLARLERRVEALGAALGVNDSVSLSIPTLLRSVADAIEASNPATSTSSSSSAREHS